MSASDERFTHGRTSVYNLNYHIIWCTKYRRKVLKNGIDSDLKTILREIADEHGYRRSDVYRVLNGFTACKRGLPHEIAVKLGLKPNPAKNAA